MVDQDMRADLSRHSFIAGTVVTVASSCAAANAQSGKDHINTRVLGTQDPTLIFVHGFASLVHSTIGTRRSRHCRRDSVALRSICPVMESQRNPRRFRSPPWEAPSSS
jgi:hypothetical protein